MSGATIHYAMIQGAPYASVRDVAAALRAKGYPEVAEWLEESASGEVVSVKRVKVSA